MLTNKLALTAGFRQTQTLVYLTLIIKNLSVIIDRSSNLIVHLRGEYIRSNPVEILQVMV
jgi:hypothetical protein